MAHQHHKGHKRSGSDSPATEPADETKKFASPAPKKTRKATVKGAAANSSPSFITQSPRSTGSRANSANSTPSRHVGSDTRVSVIPAPAASSNATTIQGNRTSTETSVIALPPRTEPQEDPQEEIFSPPGHGPHKVTLTKKTTHSRSWTETIFSPVFSFWPFQSEDKEGEEAKDEESGGHHTHREVINYESSSNEEEIEEHEGNKTTKKIIIHKNLSSDEILSESSDGEENADSEAATGQLVPANHAHHDQHRVKVNDETTLEYTIEDTEEPFNPYVFIRNLPPSTLESQLAALPPKPHDAPKITLVLDLDETLVHCSIEPFADADYSFPVLFNDREYMVHARKRPHFETFIRRMAELFEVVVFTASQKVYASKLLGILDPDCYIEHKLYRDACCCVEGNYLKDLRILGRNLAHVIIIDNSPQAFGYQVDNGIPIESWFDDRSDRELLELIPFLETLAAVNDVRPHIRERFKLHELIAQAI